MKHPVLLFVLFLVNVPVLIAQEAIIDTSYYQIYPEHITGRYYFSRKYTALKIKDKKREVDYLYMPNTSLYMGVGASDKDMRRSLAHCFRFFAPDIEQGETDYLDVPLHIYACKKLAYLLYKLARGNYLGLEAF